MVRKRVHYCPLKGECFRALKMRPLDFRIVRESRGSEEGGCSLSHSLSEEGTSREKEQGQWRSPCKKLRL